MLESPQPPLQSDASQKSPSVLIDSKLRLKARVSGGSVAESLGSWCAERPTERWESLTTLALHMCSDDKVNLDLERIKTCEDSKRHQQNGVAHDSHSILHRRANCDTRPPSFRDSSPPTQPTLAEEHIE